MSNANANIKGTLPPILPLIQQSGLQGLSQVLSSITDQGPYLPLPEESVSSNCNNEPLSPQIPDSEHLRAQVLASFHPDGSSENAKWNFTAENVAHNISERAAPKGINEKQITNKTRNSLAKISSTNSQRLQQHEILDKTDCAERQQTEKADLSLTNILQSLLSSNPSKESNDAVTVNDEGKVNHTSRSQRPKRTKRNQTKSPKKSPKIKELLSDRFEQRPKNASSTVPGNNKSSKAMLGSEKHANQQSLCAVSSNQASVQNQTQLFASHLLKKVSNTSLENGNQLFSQPDTPALLGAVGVPVVTGSEESSHNNKPSLHHELLPTSHTVGTVQPGLQSVQLLTGLKPTSTLSGSVSILQNSLPVYLHTSSDSHLQSATAVTETTATSAAGLQPTAGISQLSPGSLSLLRSLLGQLINTDATQQGKQHILSVENEESNSIQVLENEGMHAGDSTHSSEMSLEKHFNQQNQTRIPPSKQSNLSSNQIMSKEGSQITQGSVLIPFNQNGVTSPENTMVSYQQLQSIISSLISGLQGQLDATQRLMSPIMATAVHPLTNQTTVNSSGLDQQAQNLARSNELNNVHLVQFPLGQQENQLSCSSVYQNVSTTAVGTEEGHNSGHVNRNNQMPPSCALQNRNFGNQPSATSEDVMVNVQDDSFLQEQQEHLYDNHNYLYNRNMEPYLNQREDNSNMNSSVEFVIPPLIVGNELGSQDIPNPNTPRTQMLLSADSDEDSTDVPNIFKRYCLSCKAAMLNEECQFHKITYNHIKDSPILSKARISIPSCLTLQPTCTFGYNVYLGVWTKESIPAHTKFGPLVGKIQLESEKTPDTVHSFPAWKIFLQTKSESIDTSDENECNWMMFLKPARCEKTQNLVAHQLGHNIYFFTTKEVFCGQELLYWFSKEYATLSGYPCLPTEASLSECPICGKFFINKSTRKLHMKEHPHYQKFKCHICDHLYCSLSSLKRHTMLHMGAKPHVCHVCQKNFSDNSNLKVHLKLHTGTKVFNCEICQRAFRQKAHLKTHMLIHTGKKNLKCYFCDKTFAREGDRKQHEYRHTKEKSYKCEECGKIFYKLQNYKRHVLIHTGVREFACQFCMKTFGRKFHLQRHVAKCQAKNEVFEDKDMILNNVDLKGILNS